MKPVLSEQLCQENRVIKPFKLKASCSPLSFGTHFCDVLAICLFACQCKVLLP